MQLIGFNKISSNIGFQCEIKKKLLTIASLAKNACLTENDF